jgi:predicted component of viral defense system (DUF524 family)
MAIPVSGVDRWLTLNGKSLSFQEGDENLDALALENHNNILATTSYAPDDLRISVDDEEIETNRYGRWYWYPAQYAGLYQLQISAPGYSLYIANVRVLPGKLSQERYEAMLEDISSIATDLLFSLHSPAKERAKRGERGQLSSAFRDYHHVQLIVYQLMGSVAQIRRHPYQQLQEYTDQRDVHQLRQFAGATPLAAGAVITLPETTATNVGVKYLPELWNVQQSRPTYDVYENRLLKHFIRQQLLAKINFIRERAQKEKKQREQTRMFKLKCKYEDDETPKIDELQDIIEECEKMSKWCIAWASEPFLTAVHSLHLSGKATQVLLKHPFYSRFYHLYLYFQRELKLSLSTDTFVTTLPLRRMSGLYEIWAVFRATRIVLDVLEDASYQISSNNLFYEIEQDYFEFDIRRNVASITMTNGRFNVAIKYEPIYATSISNLSGLVSTDYSQLTPDMSIEVSQDNQVIHVIILDAKYKFQYYNGYNRPNDEDLNKMRKYRDLIRYKVYNPRNPGLKPRRIVSSSYILYPGNYLDHDPDEPEVGALPLVPRMSEKDFADTEEAIKDILWKAELL